MESTVRPLWHSLAPDDSVNSTPTNTARTELHSMITFHSANTRGSRAGRLRIAHLCVLKQMSSTCHVSFLAAPDTDHKHKFSLIYFTYLSDNNQHTQDLRYAILIYPAMFHGRVADEQKSHLSEVMSPSRLRSKPSTPKQSSLKTSSLEELSLTETLEQIRERFETRILKMENCKKMLASPLYMQSRKDCKSSRIPIASVKPAAMLQERGGSAKTCSS